jgi:prepilin-type N-terminal cleavage/methylation domain-containing protein
MRALKKQGFTLIEVIITLVIVGIVAVTVGMSSVQIVKSFMFSAKNADTLLKGQVAVARIAKELNNVKTVDVAATNGTKIKFTSYRDAVDHTICRGAGTTCGTSGTNLLLSEGSVANVVLTDQVSNFSLAYYDNYKGTGTTNFSANSRIIEINLEITGWENTTAKFNARVAPSFPISIGP